MTQFLFSHLLLFFVLGTHMNEFHGIRWDNAEDQTLQNKNPFQLDIGPYSMLAYVPARSCHVQLKNESGRFYPPVSYGNIDVHLWCNWTILAGPGKHIVIYIKGFRANLNCDDNHDEIIFEGVSSSVENSVVYACWNKYTHVYATEATAVHVVFLWRSFSYTPSRKYFEGKYYVFEDPDSGNNTRKHDCVVEPAQEEKLITQIAEPSTPAVLDITQDGNGTSNVNIDGPSEPDSFEEQPSLLAADITSFVTPIKDQTFIPSIFEIRTKEPTYSMHQLEKNTQTSKKEGFTRVSSNGELHSMAETHLPIHTNATTQQIDISSSVGLATLEDSVFTSKVPPVEPPRTSSYPDLHSLMENHVPTVTLHTSDIPSILDTMDITTKETFMYSPRFTTEGGTQKINREEILVSSYGELLIPATLLTSSTLYSEELKSTPAILYIPEDASLQYSVHTISDSTSSIKSEQSLEDLHDRDNSLFEATLSMAWYTDDKMSNKVASGEALEPSPLYFSTYHQEHDITSKSNTEEVSVLKRHDEIVLSETRFPYFTLHTEDELLNPGTISRDLVTKTEGSSLAPMLSIDQGIGQFLRHLPFHLDDDILTLTVVASSQTDLKEATPKPIQEMANTAAVTSDEITSAKPLRLLKPSCTVNHALTKVLPETIILNTVVPSIFVQFTASNEDLPQLVPFDSMGEGKILKTEPIHTHGGDVGYSSAPLKDRYEILEIIPTSVFSPKSHIFNQMNKQDNEALHDAFTGILVPELMSDRLADALSSVPQFAKPRIDEMKEQFNPMVNEAHKVVSNDSNLLQTFLRFLTPFDSWLKAYRTEAEEQENINPVPGTASHVAPTDEKGSKNNYFSNKVFGEQPLKPPQILFSELTKGRNTLSNILDASITTTKVIEKIKRSTSSYQSFDSNLFVEEHPRSDKVETTTYAENNMGFSHEDGLFTIIVEIEHNGIISSELESKIIESTSQNIQEKMFHLPNTESSILLKKLKRPQENSLTMTYRLQLKNGGRDMTNLIETQLNELINSSVGTPNTTLMSFSIEGFHIMHDHPEILIGSIVGVAALLLSTAVIALCILLRKKHGKENFKLQEPKLTPASTQKNSSFTHQSDSALTLSKPARGLSSRQPAEHHPAQETSSVLALTKITVEQTAF